MRQVYLVSYDIADAKRLRRVFKLLKGFGDPIQYSVFRCALTAASHVKLLERLTEEIHHREDQVVLIDLGPEGGREQDAFTTLGKPMRSNERKPTII